MHCRSARTDAVVLLGNPTKVLRGCTFKVCSNCKSLTLSSPQVFVAYRRARMVRYKSYRASMYIDRQRGNSKEAVKHLLQKLHFVIMRRRTRKGKVAFTIFSQLYAIAHLSNSLQSHNIRLLRRASEEQLPEKRNYTICIKIQGWTFLSELCE